jgi:hypothetical protein
MKRPLFWTMFCATVLAAGLAAQERPGGGKGDKKEAADQPKDIMARLAKDLAAAEERLKKADPGDETRKIQREIIDLLDELIKQTSNQQSSSGGGGQSKKGEQSKQSGSKSGAPDKNNPPKDQKSDSGQNKQDAKNGGKDDQKAQVKPGKGDENEGQAKEKGDGKKDDGKQGTAKAGGTDKDKGMKDDKDQGKKGEVKADQSETAAGGGAKQDQTDHAKKNTLADLHREPWGHLPEKMRLEMDAYSKERFMPRYEDLLQQYYRSIAEQINGKNQ